MSTDRAGRAATTGVLAARAHVRAIMGTMVSIHVVADGQRRDEPQVMDAVESGLVACGVPVSRVFSEHFKYDFAGRSALAWRMRQAWWALTAASLLGLVLALAWR